MQPGADPPCASAPRPTTCSTIAESRGPWTTRSPNNTVESLPSVYDQFKRPGFSGWDYQAMRDSGYDLD